MKTIHFTSRETGWKISAALALLPSFAVLGTFVVLFATGSGGIKGAPWILVAISVGLALFVWSVFRLIKPIGYDCNWQIAELILVPLYSLMLALAATVWVAWLIQRSIRELDDVVTPLLHGTGIY